MLLVTGGAGFIGSNVVANLNEAGRADIAVSDMLGSDGKWRNLTGRRFADFIPPAELLPWLDGCSPPPASPCSTRQPISIFKLVAIPHNADASVKTAMDNKK